MKDKDGNDVVVEIHKQGAKIVEVYEPLEFHTIDKLTLRPMSDAPKDETRILLFKDVATVLVCHIAFWREPSAFSSFADESDRGWWSYTENSVAQSKVDEFGELLGWLPMPTKN